MQGTFGSVPTTLRVQLRTVNSLKYADLLPKVYVQNVCAMLICCLQCILCRFVHAQQLEAMNVSLTFHMAMGLRPRPPACIPLQLSRHLECRLADVEGVANVRHWLQLIGACATLS